MIRAIVASAHTFVRSALKLAVESTAGIVVVAEAGTIGELVDHWERLAPDVIFIDSTRGGFESFRILGRAGVRILLVTDEAGLAVHRRHDLTVDAIGADAPLVELVRAIQVLLGNAPEKPDKDRE